MSKTGFTLIELIIGMAISAAVSVVIFVSFNQTQKSSTRIDEIISLDSRVSVLQNQLEKDITGVFVPNSMVPKPNEKVEQKAKKESKEKKEEEVAKPDTQKVEKLFYSANQGKNLKELTFITCNPLQIYGQSRPRIARVTYLLKEDVLRRGSFALYRQESSKLNDTKGGFEYQIADGIKEFRVEYTVLIEKKEEEQKQKDAKEQKKSSELKTFSDWTFADKASSTQKESNFLIPMFVNVKVVFWIDVANTAQQFFEFKYFIYAFDSQFPRKPAKNVFAEEKMQNLVDTIDDIKKKMPALPGKLRK